MPGRRRRRLARRHAAWLALRGMAVALAATATVKATTTTTPSPTATVATAPTPAATPAAGAVRVARHERGARVRGSVLVARPLSRLRVEALAKRSAVGARRAGQARVVRR